MSHYTVLCIGTYQNLQDIYDDCPDSSSDTAAEMAFGYDYLVPYEECSGRYKSLPEDTAFFFADARL